MAYSELVKNFNKIRQYMRSFYVYGFRSRSEYTEKSSRSYDDERRRIESWLGDYMQFRQAPDGRIAFISIDSRRAAHNPMYKAWKAKSFTDGDITLHFLLFDILSTPGKIFSIKEIMNSLDGYLAQFKEPRVFDVSTVRKKLNEYAAEGLVNVEKRGRTAYYSRADDVPVPCVDVLNYFSEVMPCGVIGSFILDGQSGQVRQEDREDREESGQHFAFKHHYITGTLDSQVLYELFSAIRERRGVALETVNRDSDRTSETRVIPLRIMISVQSGRQYLMAYVPAHQKITPFRADNILSVSHGEICENYDELQCTFEGMRPHLWGVSTRSRSNQRMERVEFTIRYADDEQYIRERLEREKRCGTVEHIDENTSRFTADVFDAWEMIPWIRTFICRITDIHFSDSRLEEQFWQDIREMYALYGLEGGN
ncbi:WYL domain-containing protein [Mobilibacterium timonense]|uniref:WYL domain-containing protein n=1 Tax=Mobilibacterium timonense TaxID=1871012 RepID=UPI003A9398DC